MREDTIKKGNAPSRVYTTTRLITEKPFVDGSLSDACWNTGTWAGDYVQWIPTEGAKASQPTEFKILYDDNNVYVAIRAYDKEPSKIQRQAGRRDDFQGDMVGICFDSYHDRRTGFEFDMTAYGQKIDVVITNPMNADFNWNAVWTGKVGMEDSAWVAEMEIPLSQIAVQQRNGTGMGPSLLAMDKSAAGGKRLGTTVFHKSGYPLSFRGIAWHRRVEEIPPV